MNILIAYDGSRCADAAIVDLERAGLPRGVDAAVLSVLELWSPPPSVHEILTLGPAEGDVSYLRDVERMAAAAAATVREHFPDWKVRSVAAVGVPARVILHQAEASHADLVVVGSEGHTALGRFFLGSVSHKVAVEAPCSVRVARGRLRESGDPVRVVVGLKAAPSGEEALRGVAARSWPEGTEVRLVTAVNTSPGASVDEAAAGAKALHRRAQEQLALPGVRVTSHVAVGDPRKVVVEAAEAWGAETIFVGTRDLSRTGRWALGSVSGALVARAHCSVEVVRLAP